MGRSRLTLTVDEDHRILIVRYIGDIDGEQINHNVMQQIADVAEVWTYDSLIDMRRFENTVLVTEIEDLAMRWNGLAAGRDRGCFTAVISADPLVRARLPLTQALFPVRTLAQFGSFDEGLDWLKTQRAYVRKALAS